MRGKLIVIEGIDHAGKTTQARRLIASLRKRGRRVRYLREPGGTRIGEKIRAILLDPANKRMSVPAELFLYMACRAQLVHERMLPSLRRGEIVVCDRYLFSSVAYQGAAGNLGVGTVMTIGKTAVDGLMPDLTVILDLDPRTAAARSTSPADRIEQRGIDYQRKVRAGFRAVAKLLGKRAAIVDADRQANEVQNDIERRVNRVLS